MKRLTNGRYQVRWRDADGKQRARNFVTKEQAQRFQREVNAGQHGEAKIDEPTFAEFADRWLRDHAAVAKSPTTVAVDRMWLGRHLKPYFEGRTMRSLAKADYVALRAALAAKKTERGKRPLRPKTVNHLLTLAKTITAAAYDWDVIPTDPFKGQANLRDVEHPLAYWTAEQRDRFVRRCAVRDPDFAELVFVATATGLRKGELKALQRGQLDLDGRRIRVDATYSEPLKRRLPRSKNGEVGYVPMAAAVYECLVTRRDLAPDAPVFRPGLFSDAYARLRRRCKEYGVPVIRFHDLRHTFASLLAMGGQPLYTVQQLMRHKTSQMTERYAHLAPDYLGQAVETAVSVSARNVHSDQGVTDKGSETIGEKWRPLQDSKALAG